jgi:hypothetical protein
MAIFEETITDGFGCQDSTSAIDLDEFTKVLFEHTCKTVRDRSKMPEYEQEYFEDTVKKFEQALGAILAIEDKKTREAALTAALSALSIGYFHAGNQNVLRDINEKHTRRANEGRRQPQIEEIIIRHTETYRQRFPSYKENNEGTAKGICKEVAVDVIALPKRPKDWTPPELKSIPANASDQEKKAVEKKNERLIAEWAKTLIPRISKRIARIS